MATFFDIMNIRDVNLHKFDLKPSLISFSSVDDPRFVFHCLSMTSFIPLNTVKVTFLEIQKIK